MDALWPTLIQFLLRLGFGLATAMSVTPSRWVTSGFYRVHLWVVMGFAVFASLAVYSQGEWYAANARGSAALVLGLTVSIAIASYMGATVWIYEAARLGKAFLWLVSGLCLVAGWAASRNVTLSSAAVVQNSLDWLTSGAELGFITAAMFLGHWYLNWPGMKLEPLRRLIRMSGAAIVGRAAVALAGLCLTLAITDTAQTAGSIGWWSFLSFRWLAGIVGPTIFIALTWQTLKIPNTQSATGILYAAMILAFLGELTSQLMSLAGPFSL